MKVLCVLELEFSLINWAYQCLFKLAPFTNSVPLSWKKLVLVVLVNLH